MSERVDKAATALRRASVAPRDMEASPFSAILAEFLARVPGAIAAALVDSGGETVDYAGKHDIFELKVFAAHFRILLGEASALTAGAEVTRLMVRGRKRAVLALRAPDGYAVVVVLRRRAGFAPQETSVRVLMEALAAEAGWSTVEPSGWAEVSVRRDGRGRPLELLDVDAAGAERAIALEVLGTFGARGFRVRASDGHEFNLVREPKNLWYADGGG